MPLLVQKALIWFSNTASLNNLTKPSMGAGANPGQGSLRDSAISKCMRFVFFAESRSGQPNNGEISITLLHRQRGLSQSNSLAAETARLGFSADKMPSKWNRRMIQGIACVKAVWLIQWYGGLFSSGQNDLDIPEYFPNIHTP